MHVHRLSVFMLPTRRVFSFVRLAVDPTKPVPGVAVKTSPFATKCISTTIQKFPCRCTPMHPGAISKKLSFMIIFHAHAFDGSIDVKTAAANNPYGGSFEAYS